MKACKEHNRKLQTDENRSYLRTRFKLSILVVTLAVFLPLSGFSGLEVSVSDFKVIKSFKAIKLTWKVSAPEGSEGVFEVYRTDRRSDPFVRIQEIKIGDQKFIDANTKAYFFLDKKVKPGHRYYYKLTLRGTDREFGPLQGMASKTPPGT
jgi:hypothetical protein